MGISHGVPFVAIRALEMEYAFILAHVPDDAAMVRALCIKDERVLVFDRDYIAVVDFSVVMELVYLAAGGTASG